jgi:hypothetical protein
MRKKKIDKEIEPQEKKSRAKYKCPPEVKPLIELVNLVPFPTKIASLTLEQDYQTRLLREQTGDSNASVTITDVLQGCLRDLPKEFHNYLKGFCNAAHLRSIDINKIDKMDVDQMFRAYMKFYNLHQETIGYAVQLKNDKEGKLYSWDMLPPRASGNILIDENGKNYLDGLAGIIDKIIPDRFRMCEIPSCNHIFWAENKNSLTCSEPCRNALRQRKHREKNKEEINKKRRATYQSKKEQEQGEKRSKKNGIV